MPDGEDTKAVINELLDGQKYWECQLVTAINAAMHLGEPPVTPGTLEYERLVDMVGARHGSAFQIERAHQYLRIQRTILRPRWSVVKRSLKAGRPVEGSVWHLNTGFHSVLFTGYRETRRLQYLRVWNFRKVAIKSKWLTWGWLREGFKRHSMMRGGSMWEFDLLPWHEKKLKHKRHVHKCGECSMGWTHGEAASNEGLAQKR